MGIKIAVQRSEFEKRSNILLGKTTKTTSDLGHLEVLMTVFSCVGDELLHMLIHFVKSHESDSLLFRRESIAGSSRPFSNPPFSSTMFVSIGCCTSSVDAIAKAAQDSAAAAAIASGKSQYEQVCHASQLAYNERNPHMKKEG